MSRQICPTCQRPLRVCYCSELVEVANQIKVLIIQHPLEQRHPFNTGRMAHLCLKNSELVVAEQLSEAELVELLVPSSVLLYPSLDWLPEVATHNSIEQIKQLVVIDATWRKSKKMLHLNPALQQLPRISLVGGVKSNYQVRQSSQANSLSTLESIVMAMGQLESEQDIPGLLRPFERMIELQKGSGEIAIE